MSGMLTGVSRELGISAPNTERSERNTNYWRLFVAQVGGALAATPAGEWQRRFSLLDAAFRTEPLTGLQTQQDSALVKIINHIITTGKRIVAPEIDISRASGCREWLCQNQAFVTSTPYLNLQGLGLEVLPVEIGQFTNLWTLNLAENKLVDLPDSVRCLTKLSNLNLSYNKLTAVPEEVEYLEELRLLQLQNNSLEVLPDSIGSLQELSLLNLTNNCLTELPESVVCCKQLRNLFLSNNKLSTLPDSIGSMLQQLNLLLLGDNPLKALPESLQRLGTLQLIADYGYLKWPSRCSTRS